MMFRRNFLAAIIVALMAFCCQSSVYAKATKTDFLGGWLNENPQNESIVSRLLMHNQLGASMEIQCYIYATGTNETLLGTNSIIFSGSPVTVSYTVQTTTYALTITSLNSSRIRIDTVITRRGTVIGTATDYLYKMTRPDLIISNITVPTNTLIYGQRTGTVNFTIQNIGGAALTTETLNARVTNKTKNGVPIAHNQFYSSIGYSSMGMGDSVNVSLPVANNWQWAEGDYTFQIEVNYDNSIMEENHQNNLSTVAAISVWAPADIIGEIRKGDTLMHTLTNADVNLSNLQGGTFQYDNKTSTYALRDIPKDQSIGPVLSIHCTGEKNTMPGNFRNKTSYFVWNNLTEQERLNLPLYAYEIIRMTQPFDNNNLKPYTDWVGIHPPDFLFNWDAIENASYYNIRIKKLRMATHPDGFGILNAIIFETNTNDTSLWLNLEKNEPHFGYTLMLDAYDSSDRLIGGLITTSPTGYTFHYRFQVDYNCYENLPRLKLSIYETYMYNNLDYYRVRVANHKAIPAELFNSGSGGTGSRSRISIISDTGTVLKIYSALTSPDQLNDLLFVLPEGTTPPNGVYLVLEDQLCDLQYRSGYADPYMPCPLADINGDCKVDLIDFAILANQWLLNGN